ncbi:MAG: NAD(P)H-dependent oxidoreductase [Bacteroidota bacterium]
MKNILILNAHPDKESFCFELANHYKREADSSGANCKLIHLIDLDFEPVLRKGYRQPTKLEPDLVAIQQEISNTDHLVFIYPNWWGTYPALLKGFIDRTFLPGFAFKYRENSMMWDRLLKGKTARLIVTMDSPKWYYNLFTKSPGHHSMKKGILGFCGVKVIGITVFSPMRTSNESIRNKWIAKVEELGRKGE